MSNIIRFLRKSKNIYTLIALLLVLCMVEFSSCKSTKKMGCPSQGEYKQYFKERRR